MIKVGAGRNAPSSNAAIVLSEPKVAQLNVFGQTTSA